MSESPKKSAEVLSIELSPVELYRLEKAASLKKMTVNEFVLNLVQVFTHLEETDTPSL